jgi:O-antigen/teichoic acid export membrane protein
MFVGNGTTTVLQALQFVLLARLLGPAQFGQIAATVAVTQVLLPFSGAGAGNMMVMRASRRPEVLPTYFGNALLVATLSGALLSAFAVTCIAPLLGAGYSQTLMTLACISELLFSKLIDICGQTFIALGRLRYTGRFMVLQSSMRLLALPLFMAFAAEPTAEAWICWALASNMVAFTGALSTTLRQVGIPRLDVGLARREVLPGFNYSIGISARGFYLDADKAFLARYSTSDVVGLYTSAFRMIQMSLTPIRAVAYSSQVSFFRAGERGVTRTIEVAARLAGPLGLFSILAAAVFFFAAPLVPILLGASYTASVEVVQWLCLLPLVFAAQSLLSDTLSGSGHQGIGALVQVGAAAAACVLNLLCVPTFGWKGAVLASYSSQLLLVCGLLVAVTLLKDREQSS